MTNKLLLIFTSNFYELNIEIQEQVYKEFYYLVYSMIYNFLNDHAAVEDVIQEAFLRAIKKSSQLKDLSKMNYWLMTLTRRTTINYYYKFKRQQNELTYESTFLYKEQIDPDIHIHKDIEVKILKETAIQYLRKINPKARNALELRWFHHLSYEEIAREMNLNSMSVRQLLFRARSVIRKRLHKEWHGDE